MKQILEIKQILKNNFSEDEMLRSSIMKNKTVPLYSKKDTKLISYKFPSYGNKKRNKL